MRLSDAIILGSTLNPQGFNEFKGEDGATCAWGAAYEAVGINIPEYGDNFLDDPDEWDWIHKTGPMCCVTCGEFQEDADQFIAHLNDFHIWDREAIGAFVASIEPREQAREIENCVQEQECSVL